MITGILSILKPDAMATKGQSFKDDEKIIIDIDMDMEIVVEKDINVPVFFFLNNFFGKIWNFKWRIFSCLTKLLTDEMF